MKPCWSCGSTGECYEDCRCAKCIDPAEYREWKENNPEEYEEWLEAQMEGDENEEDDDSDLQDRDNY